MWFWSLNFLYNFKSLNFNYDNFIPFSILETCIFTLKVDLLNVFGLVILKTRLIYIIIPWRCKNEMKLINEKLRNIIDHC